MSGDLWADEEVTGVMEIVVDEPPGQDFCPACGVDYDVMNEGTRALHQTDGEYVVCGCGGPFDDEEDTGVHIIMPSVTITMEMLPIERNAMRNVIVAALEGGIPMDLSTFNAIESIEGKLG